MKLKWWNWLSSCTGGSSSNIQALERTVLHHCLSPYRLGSQLPSDVFFPREQPLWGQAAPCSFPCIWSWSRNHLQFTGDHFSLHTDPCHYHETLYLNIPDLKDKRLFVPSCTLKIATVGQALFSQITLTLMEPYTLAQPSHSGLICLCRSSSW